MMRFLFEFSMTSFAKGERQKLYCVGIYVCNTTVKREHDYDMKKKHRNSSSKIAYKQKNKMKRRLYFFCFC